MIKSIKLIEPNKGSRNPEFTLEIINDSGKWKFEFDSHNNEYCLWPVEFDTEFDTYDIRQKANDLIKFTELIDQLSSLHEDIEYHMDTFDILSFGITIPEKVTEELVLKFQSENNMIYFAHSKKIYDSAQEQLILDFLSEKFGRDNIICPNKDMGELGSIKPYLNKIKGCEKVIVREYKKYVGKGVFEEIIYALKQGKKVYVIRGGGNNMSLQPVKGVKINNINDWKVKYGKLIIK